VYDELNPAANKLSRQFAIKHMATANSSKVRKLWRTILPQGYAPEKEPASSRADAFGMYIAAKPSITVLALRRNVRLNFEALDDRIRKLLGQVSDADPQVWVNDIASILRCSFALLLVDTTLIDEPRLTAYVSPGEAEEVVILEKIGSEVFEVTGVLTEFDATKPSLLRVFPLRSQT